VTKHVYLFKRVINEHNDLDKVVVCREMVYLMYLFCVL
jgi:hypothetical protein